LKNTSPRYWPERDLMKNIEARKVETQKPLCWDKKWVFTRITPYPRAAPPLLLRFGLGRW
jgi:hypothetical protein